MDKNATLSEVETDVHAQEFIFPSSPALIVVGVVYILRFLVAVGARGNISQGIVPPSRPAATSPMHTNESNNDSDNDISETIRDVSSVAATGTTTPTLLDDSTSATTKALISISLLFDTLDTIALAVLSSDTIQEPAGLVIGVFTRAVAFLFLAVLVRCFFRADSSKLQCFFQFTGAMCLLCVPVFHKDHNDDLALVYFVPMVVWACSVIVIVRLMAITTSRDNSEGVVVANPFRSCLKRFWLYSPPLSYIDGDLNEIDSIPIDQVQERRPLSPPNNGRTSTLPPVRTQELVMV
jgi:hypothetical protein